MTIRPTVSVVIATYNYGRFLAAALDSVFMQTFQDFEIIVIDDGSTDDTSEVIRSYLGDPRVHYLRTDHLGQPAAKNAGIRGASGEFVAFLDADDIWLPTKLDKQIELIRSDPTLGVVHCKIQPMNEHGVPTIIYQERPMYRGWVLDKLFHRPFICFSSSMIRRDVLEEVGGFDETIPLSIDYDLWLRIAMRYQFDHVDERLVLYRSGHANLSRRLVDRCRCIRKIIRRFLNEHGGAALLDRSLCRQVWTEHCCDTASAFGKPCPFRAFAWYGRALATCPWHGPAWKSLATFWWPDRLRSTMLRLLKRPDWRQVQATPVDPI